MDRPVTFTDYIKPICLPPPDLIIPNGTPCVVSGWGRSRKGGKISDILQEVAVKLMSDERQSCKIAYPSVSPKIEEKNENFWKIAKLKRKVEMYKFS
mgnify:CR=1 FL=1